MDIDSEHSWEMDDEEIFIRDLRRVRRNDPRTKRLYCDDDYDIFEIMMTEEWEDIGRDISNNTYLEELKIVGGVLEEEQISSLFRGLSRGISIVMLELRNNGISAAGLRSLEPFVQNSTNLRRLSVSYNVIQTEGFNILMRALRDKPIERLDCSDCDIISIDVENIENVPTNLRELILDGNDIQSEGFNRLFRSLRESSIEVLSSCNCNIESIEIVTDSFPRKLKTLNLGGNRINSNGCNEIAKLLRERDTKFQDLFLENNLVDDEGVAILADALKTNTSLKSLHLVDNDGISRNGRLLMLELLNDISSIKATLQSNHTLQTIRLGGLNDDIFHYTDMALSCNIRNSVRAGREKVIRTQLHSRRRAKYARIQCIQHSLYNEINPLHLPEVLSLVSNWHGQEELYVALKASIAELMSTVNRKRCIQQRIVYHDSIIAKHESVIAEQRAKQRELREELATIEEVSSANYHIAKTKQINAELERIEAAESNSISGNTSNKRRRKWWWGIWR